jgi:hypothetical protein
MTHEKSAAEQFHNQAMDCTTRQSRNRAARSVWSARSLLPLWYKPTIQSASKLSELAHSIRFAANFTHRH